MDSLPNNQNKLLTVQQAADFLGVATKTLRRWDKAGRFTPLRTVGNQRRYTTEQIHEFKNGTYHNNVVETQNFASLQPTYALQNPIVETQNFASLRYLAFSFICVLIMLFSRLTGDGLIQFGGIISPLPSDVLSRSSVLAENTIATDFVFNVNVPANFYDLTVFEKNITAPNIVYSIKAGTGISVTGTQTPTIANTGVLSLQGQTGAISFTAGGGISISGTTISNSGILSLTAGDGMTVSGSTVTNADRGSSQYIFKNIAIGGTSFSATKNNDTFTFAPGLGIGMSLDTVNKTISIAGLGGDLNVSGWTRYGTNVGLTTSTDNVGIGTTDPTQKLDVAGSINASGNVIAAGNLNIGGTGYFGNLFSTGNVGIGTTAAGTTLYVNGTQTTTGAVSFGSSLAVTGGSSLNAINNNNGGITNAGPVTGATGLTSSGTVTFSGLSTGIVHSNFSGVLSSSAVNLTNGDVDGILPISRGGTTITSYLKGDMIYASADNVLTNLGIGGSAQVLTVSSGLPVWGTAVGGEFCPTCIINNPGSTQYITPAGTSATGLSIKQASGGLVDIFNVTSFDGLTKYFKVNSNGNVIVNSLGIGSSGTLTSAPLTAERTWTLPNATGNFCLDTGNCSGVGGNLGGSGTANYLARWNAQYILENSTIYDNGNIGIGTTNPTSKLYVSGNEYVSGGVGIGGSLQVIGLTDLDSTLSVAGAVDMNSTLGVTGATNLSSTLDVTSSITGGGTLKINGLANSWILGNFGIGTSAPSYKLDINGALKVGGTAYFASNVGIGTTSPLALLDVHGTIENGLVAWWPLDNNATDKSIGGHNGTMTNSVCATGYILVPGNATYGTSDFCVMQYEAKSVGGVATSQADVTPWTSINQTNAAAACVAASGHLITNNEWMTIARNIEQVAGNWANNAIGSTVGSGGLKRGNVGITDSASYDGSNPEFGTGRNSKASLTLSNGQVIWDLSGNVWEWVNNSITCAGSVCTSVEMPYDATPLEEWVEFPNLATYGQLSYDLIRPSISSWNSSYGVGQIYTDANDPYPVGGYVHALIRGGGWADGAAAGAFEMHLNYAPSSTNGNIGFRCVR